MAAMLQTIRAMLSADVAASALLEQRTDSSWLASKIQCCLQDASYQCWVVSEQSTLIAYAIAKMLVDELHIMTIAVKPDHRRQGIGQRLLQHTLSASATAKIAILEVRVDNTAAIALYKGLGFQQIGVRKNYYYQQGQYCDAEVYRLQL